MADAIATTHPLGESPLRHNPEARKAAVSLLAGEIVRQYLERQDANSSAAETVAAKAKG